MFPVESDEHFPTLARYVERNALRGNLVERAQDWRWSSLWRRVHSAADDRRWLSKWPIHLLLASAVIVPAMFWQRVWFGTRLSDEEIRRRLTEPEEPRAVQHACEQISQRMQKDPDAARRFYDLLVPLADHSSNEVRCAVAWCMGEDDTQYASFHQALLRFPEDEAPRVRHNAAIALARFGDTRGAGGRHWLHRELRPTRPRFHLKRMGAASGSSTTRGRCYRETS